MSHGIRVLGLSLAAVLLGTVPPATGAVTITPVGSPTFEVTDTHVYAAPTDPQSFRTLFPSHFPTRVVHGPPYDQEFADGLALTGYAEKELFHVSEFTAPSAVHFGFVLIPGPNAPTGSSFDFSSGPIIASGSLPILIRGDVYLNGSIYEQNAFGLSLPADTFDGRSHFLVDVWENSTFGPPGLSSLIGDYEYRLALRDPNDNGYDVLASFQTDVPEPAALTQFGLMAVVLGGWTWWRRKPDSPADPQLKR